LRDVITITIVADVMPYALFSMRTPRYEKALKSLEHACRAVFFFLLSLIAQPSWRFD